MTYKEMTREIESIDRQIAFLYKIVEKAPTGFFSNDTVRMGDVINSLLAYKNYLKYKKEWKYDTSS